MSMDPILRTALDWFIRETDSRAALAEIHQALRELRSKVDKLPSRLFYLDSPDDPYDLAQILMAMGKHAVAWQLRSGDDSRAQIALASGGGDTGKGSGSS